MEPQDSRQSSHQPRFLKSSRSNASNIKDESIIVLETPTQPLNHSGSIEPLASEASNVKNNGDDQDIDPRVERHVRWKLDLTILPLLTSVQFLAQMVGPYSTCSKQS